MKKFIFPILMLAIPFCMQLHARGNLTDLSHDQLITLIEKLECDVNTAQATYQAAVEKGENQAAVAELKAIQSSLNRQLERANNEFNGRIPIPPGHNIKRADD